MLNSGSIIDCPVTSRDVILSDSIYGPAEQSLKGRTTNRAGQDNRTWEPTEVVEKPIHEMHSDVMYLSGMPFLVSVFTPIDLTSVRILKGSRNHPNIRAGLDEQLNTVERAGLTVTTINCDGEFDADQVQGPMTNRGIRVNICGPEAHVPVAERKVRLVNERCRAILAGLPYRLPSKLVAYLVMFVVFCLNCVPVQAAGFSISPREWLTGRKLKYKRDLRFEFGSYIQARTPRVVSNSMQPRTEGDIALLSTGNVEGTIWCYNLATDRVVQRNHWTVLPIPDVVIRHMNELSRRDRPNPDDDRVPDEEQPVQPDLGRLRGCTADGPTRTTASTTVGRSTR